MTGDGKDQSNSAINTITATGSHEYVGTSTSLSNYGQFFNENTEAKAIFEVYF